MMRALSPPTLKATAHDFKVAERCAFYWKLSGFTSSDARAWLRAGLDPEDYDLAADFVQERITPERAGEQFTHVRTGERVTPIDVVRRFYSEWPVSEFRTLMEAFDDGGLERARGPRPTYLLRRQSGA